MLLIVIKPTGSNVKMCIIWFIDVATNKHNTTYPNDSIHVT